jgi:hypothetical protein
MKKKKLKKRIQQLEKCCKRMSKELLKDAACWDNEAECARLNHLPNKQTRFTKWARECEKAAKW